MKSFRIVDKEGNIVPINQLDTEAAEFWGRKVHPTRYSSPKPEGYDQMSELEQLQHDLSANWFDMIGWNIANQGNHTTGWANVVYTMCVENLGRVFINKENSLQLILNAKTIAQLQYLINEYYKPYLDLINNWAYKGYQPR